MEKYNSSQDRKALPVVHVDPHLFDLHAGVTSQYDICVRYDKLEWKRCQMDRHDQAERGISPSNVYRKTLKVGASRTNSKDGSSTKT